MYLSYADGQLLVLLRYDSLGVVYVDRGTVKDKTLPGWGETPHFRRSYFDTY